MPETLGGYTPIQSLIRSLDERSINYTVKWQNEIIDSQPVGLFWTTPWSETMWKKYNQVQMHDTTYRTNKTG